MADWQHTLNACAKFLFAVSISISTHKAIRSFFPCGPHERLIYGHDCLSFSGRRNKGGYGKGWMRNSAADHFFVTISYYRVSLKTATFNQSTRASLSVSEACPLPCNTNMSVYIDEPQSGHITTTASTGAVGLLKNNNTVSIIAMHIF